MEDPMAYGLKASDRGSIIQSVLDIFLFYFLF